MWILIVYVLIVVIGEAVVIAIGLTLDRIYPLASLPVSLSLFFAVLAFGWPLAVRWTEPKPAKERKTCNLNLRPEWAEDYSAGIGGLLRVIRCPLYPQ